MNLLPCPRSLKTFRGTFTLPKETADLILGSARLRRASSGVAPDGIRLNRDDSNCTRDARVPQSEFYTLTISKTGIEISFRETGGLRAATTTLRQLLRQFGRKLPCLKIRDWPDFPRRGVMLDISRGRVPKLETLLDLAEKLADFKINELQLYTEHTFAYREFKSVWRDWGALTASEIRRLDARCRELGIDLVPNQNSFGHLRQFLEYAPLKKIAEVSAPYESESGDFLRYPSTLAPNHPDTFKFLRGLYDELLPNFSSRFFNVGCDETWDLGRGQSKKLCERFGKGKVYLDFLKKIHREVSARGKTMMFWGDIILKYPELISELARGSRGKSSQFNQSGLTSAATDVIALNWGYEADHPFAREAAQFAKAKIPFYVCPGTSTWQTLVGKHDNALANLKSAAQAGKKFGAIGYLITDWGDGGHPQPLAVSWPMFVAGASLGWCAKTFDEKKLVPVLSRDVFEDSTGNAARAAMGLGFAHRKLDVAAPNETPLGSVIAAPPPEQRELFCRNGLKYFSRISAKNIRAALREIVKFQTLAKRAHPENQTGRILKCELELASRMAAQSCKFMLWQQARAAEKNSRTKALARNGIRELRKLEKDFNAYWPARNQATPKHCSAFLQWRINDYQNQPARSSENPARQNPKRSGLLTRKR
ncbi:MAG TPA: family 20 glycosylhydrolase [Verrucomicrobiae bacterium]|nr:family 20 glycosylhydrolase [Verrucomicrobiae bacterium]